MTTTTQLVLSAIDMADFAARGISESLSPIGVSAQTARSWNGTLVDLSDTTHRKLKAAWRCTDLVPPALNGIWPGQLLTVDCISWLNYVTSGGSPAHTVVTSSSYTEGALTFYRPRLTMRITAPWTADYDEWEAVTAWTLEAEEV